MKKLVVCMLIGAMVLGTTACGNKNTEESSVAESSSAVESSSAAESTQESVAESSEVVEPEIAPEEAGAWSEEMAGLREAVVTELGTDYWPAMAIPAEILEANFGLTSDMYVDYMGEMPMMSAHVDTLLIVKAAEGQEEAVEQALQAYRDVQAENSMQYPMNLGKVQASVVERMDSYVVLALLGGDTMDAEVQGGEEAVIKKCQEHNERALNVIAQKLGVER
ncbi:MAG: DUF4358 domain-containing protein [Lachnospiraceae bacterium]|nr:DUF4358 domain-containing protein [Lachnospiraceae bacterium]